MILIYSYTIPRTKIRKDKLLIRPALSRKFKDFKWDAFKHYEILSELYTKILFLYLKGSREIFRISLGRKNYSLVNSLLEKKIARTGIPLLEVNDTLDIPVFSKGLYWGSLGALFVLIGAIPLLLMHNYSFIPFAVTFLVIWLLIAFWLFAVVCYPRTKLLDDGVVVRSLFTLQKKYYKWYEIKAFAINQEGVMGYYFLYLHTQNKLFKIGIGRRNPEEIQSFLQERPHFIERRKPEGEFCKYHKEEPAYILCDQCGMPICQRCIESQTYSDTDYQLSCLPCFYKQFFRMTRISLIIGGVFGSFILIFPYENYEWVLFLISGDLLGGIFLSIGLATAIGNSLRLREMQRREIEFDYEKQFLLTKWLIIILIIIPVTIIIRLLFVLILDNLEGGTIFNFLPVLILFLALHQGLFWPILLKFKP